ncbi:MAG: ParB/RepB/Spo0J family partition protein [Chloroflexi bacterium]|nr:ParB/RepB/Spo0J family partition protein [Chloroflexota bacterium]
MARKKRPKISLAQPVQPKAGDLESLFATSEDAEQASGLQLAGLRLDVIEPDPDQPRNTFPEESLLELSDSIRQDGVIQPIEVTEIGPNRYLIVHGERRWRAAQLAGLATIPAVIQRRDYDIVTRFVRQMVENIQREDLNDVDRAAGLLHLRDLMQEELTKANLEAVPSDEPWGKKMTWAKVGKRLGYSRQRIHQLINLLKLPDEIKQAVRDGALSERETRIYQGLKPSQQRALHQARLAGEITPQEVKQIATQLKKDPDRTVAQIIRFMRQPPQQPEPLFTPVSAYEPVDEELGTEQDERQAERPYHNAAWSEEQIIPTRTGGPTSIDRLDWIRGHLARIQRSGLTQAEQQEILRLLYLIQQDVASLIDAISTNE